MKTRVALLLAAVILCVPRAEAGSAAQDGLVITGSVYESTVGFGYWGPMFYYGTPTENDPYNLL